MASGGDIESTCCACGLAQVFGDARYATDKAGLHLTEVLAELQRRGVTYSMDQARGAEGGGAVLE